MSSTPDRCCIAESGSTPHAVAILRSPSDSSAASRGAGGTESSTRFHVAVGCLMGSSVAEACAPAPMAPADDPIKVKLTVELDTSVSKMARTISAPRNSHRAPSTIRELLPTQTSLEQYRITIAPTLFPLSIAIRVACSVSARPTGSAVDDLDSSFRLNWAHHWIASTNQHPTSVGAK